ncbi:MAG: hypothetical protein ACRERD_01040, partial [Candidatus Binatia bacterium]
YQEGLSLTQKLAHPFSLAMMLGADFLHQYLRAGQVLQAHAEAAITVSTEQGFPIWLALGTIMRGWALAEQGQGEDGITQMRQGLAAWRAAEAEGIKPYYLALLAEGYGKVGQPEDGLTVLAEAPAIVDKTGQRCHEPELYRLTGQLTLQKFQVPSSKFQVPSYQPPTPNSQPPTPNSQPPSGGGSRSVFSQSHRNCPSAEGAVVGVAGGGELEPAVAAAG